MFRVSLRGLVTGLLLLLVACTESPAVPNPRALPPINPPNANVPTPSGLDAPVSAPAGPANKPVRSMGVQGIITNRAGQPLADVLVVPVSTDTPPRALPEIALRSDAQGSYFWSLPPGNYTLTFTLDGYAPLLKNLTLTQGQTVTLDVVLNGA